MTDLTKEQFDIQKAQRVDGIEARLEMLKEGTLQQALELELALAKRLTYEQSKQDRRFIVN